MTIVRPWLTMACDAERWPNDEERKMKMDSWAEATMWVTLIVAVLIYNLYKLKNARDPKEELLKAKQLLDQGLIELDDYEKIKSNLLKRIVSE